MNTVLTLFVSTPILALMFLAYRRPVVSRTSTFRFARSVTGVTLFFYVVTSVMSYVEKMSDEAFGVWLGFVVATWVGVMVSIRGVFEVLALKKE